MTWSPPPIIAMKFICCSICDINSPISPSSCAMLPTIIRSLAETASSPPLPSAVPWAARKSPASNAMTASLLFDATV